MAATRYIAGLQIEKLPLVRIGRPPSTRPLKVPTTIRFDPDVLAALKNSGKGWQTRVNAAMRDWLITRSSTKATSGIVK